MNQQSTVYTLLTLALCDAALGLALVNMKIMSLGQYLEFLLLDIGEKKKKKERE